MDPTTVGYEEAVPFNKCNFTLSFWKTSDRGNYEMKDPFSIY